jgi:hypothetical protein
MQDKSFVEQICICFDTIYNHHLFAQQHVHMNEMKLLFNPSAEQGLYLKHGLWKTQTA